MRRLFIIAWAASLYGTVNGYSQTDSLEARDKAVPLLWAARHRATKLGVANLRERSPGPGLHELRLWYGFGLFGTGMVRMWEQPRGWRLCQYLAEGETPADSGAAAKRPLIPSKDIARAWKRAVAEGLFELPPSPRRPKSTMIALDGHSWVLEWYDGAHYGAAGADNPDAYKSSDDQHLERVVAHITALWRRPLPICKDSP